MSEFELKRYARQIALPEIGVAGQSKLAAAKVLVIGAGGLGSPCLLYLCQAGIGHLGIVDADHVELSNLHRQILFNDDDVRKSKVECAKQTLQQKNPHCKITTYQENINEQNALQMIENYDIVVDGSDNFYTRYVVNDACYGLKKPLVQASVIGFQGHCAVFTSDTPCYRCMFPNPPLTAPDCNAFGTLGSVTGILGCLQANEVIKLILETDAVLTDHLLSINLLTLEFKKFKRQLDPNCLCCQQKKSFHELPRFQNNTCTTNVDTFTTDDHNLNTCITPVNISTARANDSNTSTTNSEIVAITAQQLLELTKSTHDYLLLDVRTPPEFDAHHFPDSLNIPLNELPTAIATLNQKQPIIVICQAGIRSAQAAKILKQANFHHVQHLAGGLNTILLK